VIYNASWILYYYERTIIHSNYQTIFLLINSSVAYASQIFWISHKVVEVVEVVEVAEECFSFLITTPHFKSCYSTDPWIM
jgi:hypothetical protein